MNTSLDSRFLDDVVQGLSQRPKKLPSKYFYDAQGAHYFEGICRSPEYYVTRTEITIMEKYAGQIAKRAGPDCLLVEYGSGSSLKSRLLLDHLAGRCAYVPIDICQQYLDDTVWPLMEAYPQVEILPVCADFTKPLAIPPVARIYRRILIYFPGSTIGNFNPKEAAALLRQMRSLGGKNGMVLIGIDLKKDNNILHRAYNDHGGLTAAFNLNLLNRINRELNADFIVENFAHHAFYNDRQGRIEMHLISLYPQLVTIDNNAFYFERGESIETEYSYKYGIDELKNLAGSGGFKVNKIWTDDRQFFAVALLTAENNGQVRH